MKRNTTSMENDDTNDRPAKRIKSDSIKNVIDVIDVDAITTTTNDNRNVEHQYV